MRKLIQLLFGKKQPQEPVQFTAHNTTFTDDLIDFHNPNLVSHYGVEQVL